MKMGVLTLVTSGFVLTLVCLLVAASESNQGERSSMNDKTSEQLLELEQNFQRAIVENDADAIGRFIADDWIIVDAEGGIIEKDKFLAVIRSGALTHNTMTLEQPRVRVYGNTAVVTGRATSSGKYNGAGFTTLETSTDVFVRLEGRWRCVLTQLTRLAGDKRD
jgi:ketosteroid isomerase-like protein